MKSRIQKITSIIETKEQIEGVRVGRIVNVKDSGEVFVDFPGNSRGPVNARIITSTKQIAASGHDIVGREVLLVFENNDPDFPIIIDTIYSLLDEISEETMLDGERPREAVVDGRRVVLEADEEIVLKCGKSSITLTRAGKILIRGAYILNRSSGANKIKGASIELN